MANLSELKETKVKHIMLFGPPKSGKTKRAGELAKYKKLKWFDIEKGFGTLFQLPAEVQKNVELFHIPDTTDSPMAIETILKIVKGAKVSFCSKHGKVSCPLCIKANTEVPNSAEINTIELNALDSDEVFVIDSATQLKQSAMNHIAKGKPVDYKFEFDDWAKLGRLMDIFFSYIQNATYNAIVISHEDEVKMVDGATKLVPVGGTTKFSRNVAKYFDEVIYFRVVNGKHKMASSTATDNNILTGSRANMDFGKMENPSLHLLWEA